MVKKYTSTRKSDGPIVGQAHVRRRGALAFSTPDLLQRRCAHMMGEGRISVAQAKKNTTGMPDSLKQGMQNTFQRDFSGVTVHPSSSSAPAVGALAYTQGSNIHFAPGQYRPDTSSGRELIGHDLAHVVQQSEGRVTPTCTVAGMPVNDNPRLESEADTWGKRAAR